MAVCSSDVHIQTLVDNLMVGAPKSQGLKVTVQDLDNLKSHNEDDVVMLDVENEASAENLTSKLDSNIKEIMEVDLSSEDKENIKNFVHQLSRKELENMMLKKIVDAMNSHTAIGSLRSKILSLFAIKDKLFLKSNTLTKQVAELSKAVQSIANNNAQNPKPAKPTGPLRFYRSVGLQVSIDPKANIPAPNRKDYLKNGPNVPLKASNQIPTPGLIPLASTTNKITGKINLQMNGPVATINKPILPVSAVVASKQNPVNTNKWVAKKATALPPSNILRQQQQVVTKPLKNFVAQATASALVTANAKANKTTNGLPNLVDLTDESKKQNIPAVTVGQNGVMQYRLLNPAGMFFQSPAGYQLVTQVGQTRPLILAHQKNGTRATLHQPRTFQIANVRSPRQGVVFRSLAPKPAPTRAINSAPKSVVVGDNNVMGNLAGVNRPQIAPRTACPNNIDSLTPKKFILPPLPPASIGTQMIEVNRRQTKDVPTKPELTLGEQNAGIVLSWSLELRANNAEVQSYQIFACQEPLNPVAPIKVYQWKRVGDVKALPLPMACTLSQFTSENRYHFIVRGIDVYNRTGPFCDPVAIVLKKKH